MKQLTTLDRKKSGRPIVDGNAAAIFRKMLYPVLMLLCKTKVKYKIKYLNSLEIVHNNPVIFAANHSAFPDIPIILKATGRQSYVLVGTQRLALEDKLFFELNGSVWVNRNDNEDTCAAKEALTMYLKKGHSVLWFPEGTWNLTENLLMLPMKWGIIDVALKTGAQIVPVVLEYDDKNRICSILFGQAFVPEENKEREIIRLRDVMATLRFELWERKGIFKRDDLDIEICREELMRPVFDYPSLEWEKEQTVIFRPYISWQEVFSFMRKLLPCRENAFLWKDKMRVEKRKNP